MRAITRPLAVSGMTTTVAALILGCAAPPEEKVARFVLADRTYLEVRLPRGWTLEPSFADGQRLAQARLSAREPGSTQMWIIPRLDGHRSTPSSVANLPERARRELAAGKDCEGVGTPTQERSTARGVAVFCARPREGTAPYRGLLPTTAGAVALPGLLVRFAMLGVTDEEHDAAWRILNALQVATIESSP